MNFAQTAGAGCWQRDLVAKTQYYTATKMVPLLTPSHLELVDVARGRQFARLTDRVRNSR